MSAETSTGKPGRIVVKVGTRLVVGAEGRPDREFMARLARQIAELHDGGCQVLLVTSGAVHLGRHLMLGDTTKTLRVSERTAAAALGQPELMRAWAEAFRDAGLLTAQVLLTQDDIVHRARCVNLHDTLDALLRRHIVPLLNENDSVSGVDTTFGENDNLAAMVAVALTPSDLLVYLQDEEGLMTADPREDSQATLIPRVEPDEDLTQYATTAAGPESLGGMAKKIEGARRATDCGIRVVIAAGRAEHVLQRIVRGEAVGTCLLPRPRMPSRKAWLTVHGMPAGALIVDDGACRALLRAHGSSLLPSGIIEARGEFHARDLVTVTDLQGREIARGLVNYSAAEVARIIGKHSSEIPELLGRPGEEEVIHRDDMVVTGN